ncbi:histidine phosphatase family protein [Gordonia sp. HY002]|uniref:SixA phosphatase family protein n=1 Tax=Gordonia zhenghanii TaxID=2911516 RepID=UPI001EF061DF|nr:histidine phosphatase family protein [Gordonia zhenghanii]MCF8570124.1 histidine phosphatase family protein [Gordonia zhenghanii]MCF8605409.1 histidine phosphatase family protein [Gordonia zhenghanii]
MSRTLILLRHGKSDYPLGVADHERPLNERGRRQAALAGDWIRDDGYRVDAVLCSTATRTRSTLERAEIDAPTEYVADIYGGTPDELLEVLRIHAPAEAETVVMVGHFPGVPETALTLDADGSIDRFPTSAYAVVQVGVEWDRIGLDTDPEARLVALRIPR